MAHSINGAHMYFFNRPLDKFIEYNKNLHDNALKHGISGIINMIVGYEGVHDCGPRLSLDQIRKIEKQHQEEMPIADSYTFH